MACAHIFDLVIARGLWGAKCGSAGAEGQLQPPMIQQAPGFIDSLIHGLSCIQKSCNLERQVSGGQEGAKVAGWITLLVKV